MSARLAALIVTVCLSASGTVLALSADLSAEARSAKVEARSAKEEQAPAQLSRQHRELLSGLVAAVDRATTTSTPAGHEWLTHVLRASDGSHYVAFSLAPPATALPPTPIVLYVRLATAVVPGETAIAERSTVREWLQGSRVDPRMLPRRGGVAIGEMPPMGAGGITTRGATTIGSGDLQVIALERERARQRKEEDEKRRRAELEGNIVTPSDLLPFEDFEIGAAASFVDGTRAIQRALTAGPGGYELSVAWVDASQPASKAQYHVARRSLQLAPANPEFGLSSIIVADGISVRPAPYDALQQRAHPYAIGLTDIAPARDAIFTPSQQIAVAFQIINPTSSTSGKPDVRISPRITRLNGTREETVATLSPLVFDAATLPPDFDVRLGHPLIAAFAAPLATIPRGDYRLLVNAEDRGGSSVVAARAEFTVIGTPESLLGEAPPLGPRFRSAAVLEKPVIDDVLDRLAVTGASPALARAFESARAGRFAELLVADTVPAAEQGTRAALSGLALLSLANPSATVEFQRALQLRAPAAAVEVLMGAARALSGRDAEAVAAWEAARQAGFRQPAIDRLIAEAYLRQRDFARAAAYMSERPAQGESLATFAATRIGTGRPADAVGALETLLAQRPDEDEARWLLVHALYAQFVGGDRSVAARLRAEAQRYIDAKGPHAALAAEWLEVVTSS
jgi:hypothetical protein